MSTPIHGIRTSQGKRPAAARSKSAITTVTPLALGGGPGLARICLAREDGVLVWVDVPANCLPELIKQLQIASSYVTDAAQP